MIEPGLAFNIAAVIVAAIIGAIAGGRRGVSAMSERAQHHLEMLVAAQELRIAHLEADRQNMTDRIAELESELAAMKKELELERKITARLKS